jgi:hypothetical protein
MKHRYLDSATQAIRTPFAFASDISDSTRPMAIDGSLELIERGYHREAMFWIAVTHSRCQKVLSIGAPGELTLGFKDSYQKLVGDLGITSFAELQRRRSDVERILPRVWELAEAVIAANQEIEDD